MSANRLLQSRVYSPGTSAVLGTALDSYHSSDQSLTPGNFHTDWVTVTDKQGIVQVSPHQCCGGGDGDRFREGRLVGVFTPVTRCAALPTPAAITVPIPTSRVLPEYTLPLLLVTRVF